MFDVNHSSLFIAAGVVILFVLAQSLFFLIKAWKRALALGLSRIKLRRVISSTILFTLAPAFAVLIGMVTLAKFLGLPLPWLRLSVLGALTYELPAATSAANAMNISLSQTITNPRVYAAVAWVMTLGILSGILIILFFEKKMQQGLLKIRAKDIRWGKIFMDSLFMGMIAAFLGMIFTNVRAGLVGFIPVFVMLFSALLMTAFGLLIRKSGWKFLENYAMPLAMVGAMAFSIPLTQWIQR